MKLEELEVYKLSREISREAWDVYSKFDWQTKKIIGDQFITAIDSVGANIAEGWGRFHYSDKNKFNYNARGSLTEGEHWLDLLFERGFISEAAHAGLKKKILSLHLKLNSYIKSTKEQLRR